MGRSAGSNYYWDDTTAQQVHYNRAREICVATAQRGADLAKDNLQESSGSVGQDTSEPGEYPAKQTKTLYDAIDGGFFYENRWVIAARFGVYGQDAMKVSPEWAEQGSMTPVGAYAYYLETGTEDMKARPWATMTLEQLIQEGWQYGAIARGVGPINAISRTTSLLDKIQ